MILEKESKIVVLSLWMEIVGLLRHLEEQEDELLAEIGSQRVALPVELKEALCPRLGSRIAILRTDIPGKQYLVRDLPENKQNEREGQCGICQIVNRSREQSFGAMLTTNQEAA
ncbi:MAG: hypothetical protein ABR985_07375 [Methanotrichaceae archaeon]|jgi:hypothetical protein